MKLQMNPSSFNDWYLIERAEHDGKIWFEEQRPSSLALRTSARFSDADVEGTRYEMLAIADAITQRGAAHFKRCAVVVSPRKQVSFHSPRNSQIDGVCTLAEADELSTQIKTYFKQDKKCHL